LNLEVDSSLSSFPLASGHPSASASTYPAPSAPPIGPPARRRRTVGRWLGQCGRGWKATRGRSPSFPSRIQTPLILSPKTLALSPTAASYFLLPTGRRDSLPLVSLLPIPRVHDTTSTPSFDSNPHRPSSFSAELLDIGLHPPPPLLAMPLLAALLHPLVLRVSIPTTPSPSCARRPHPASAPGRIPPPAATTPRRARTGTASQGQRPALTRLGPAWPPGPTFRHPDRSKRLFVSFELLTCTFLGNLCGPPKIMKLVLFSSYVVVHMAKMLLCMLMFCKICYALSLSK
jgi:hypothetical protein